MMDEYKLILVKNPRDEREEFLVNQFYIEVSKDFDGDVGYHLMGENIYNREVGRCYIHFTRDFNEAYGMYMDLCIKTNSNQFNEKQKRPVTGRLKRKKVRDGGDW